MWIRFWGTRGSIPKAGPTTVRYGGDTSCIELRSAGGTLLVLDCGTGAHALGQALMRDTGAGARGHILITHTHWDHIQGFPFFAPLQVEGNEWDVYGPRGFGLSLRDTLAGQMQYSYFPLELDQLRARVRYHDLVEGTFTIGDISITSRYLNHPALTLGYRFEADGVSVVYATDHEPHSPLLATEPSGAPLAGEDRHHADFLAGADLVVHDAQYLATEYPAKLGWGHSTIEYAVAVAGEAGVKRLALFHHDPLRDDGAIDRLIATARERIATATPGFEVIAAAVGDLIEIAPRRSAAASRAPAPVAATGTPGVATAMPEHSAALAEPIAVLGAGDPATAAVLTRAAAEEGVGLVCASSTEEVLRRVREAAPSLVLLDSELRGGSLAEICRAIRATVASPSRDLPIVLLAAAENREDGTNAPAEATDRIVKPFSVQYARARLRAWLLRTACRWIPAALPDDEEARRVAVRRLGLLDTAREERFDRIVRLAATLFDTPMASLTLVDADRQWCKSIVGSNVTETSRDASFCAHTILGGDVVVVPDALGDRRFADNPAVVGEPRVRFYAGCPLSADGHRVGALCVMDRRPREIDEKGRRVLRELAAIAEGELGGRKPA
jgi:phosphoribosyl 1,2-cyclic phosphodiesterase/DNA-binding response OmpR family regulator